MFNLIKFGLHFTHPSFGALDPMVLELIRTERMMRREQEKKVAESVALRAGNDDTNGDNLSKAA